jgi:hypothetical protein
MYKRPQVFFSQGEMKLTAQGGLRAMKKGGKMRRWASKCAFDCPFPLAISSSAFGEDFDTMQPCWVRMQMLLWCTILTRISRWFLKDHSALKRNENVGF